MYKDIFPKFVMLCGVPGSGKTTVAEHLMYEYYKSDKPCIHLSSDEIRKEIFGDAGHICSKEENFDVFRIMRDRAIEYVDIGFTVIYDATNITRKSRKSILQKIPEFVYKECIIVWETVERCIERDKYRERTVGEDVINSMLRRFQAPFYDEGFDCIRIYNTHDCGTDLDGWRSKYLKFIEKSMKIEQDNHHHTMTVKKHCDMCEDLFKRNTIGYRDNIYDIISYACKYHDIGKPFTKEFKDAKGNPTEEAHYYGHQGYGAWVCYGMFNDVHIAWLVSSHMEPYLNTNYWRSMPKFLKRMLDTIHSYDELAH